jgi:hypothetical protein
VSEYNLTQADPGSYAEQPCGCQSWTQQGQFIMAPCSQTCSFYAAALKQTKAAGNDVRYRWKD